MRMSKSREREIVEETVPPAPYEYDEPEEDEYIDRTFSHWDNWYEWQDAKLGYDEPREDGEQ